MQRILWMTGIVLAVMAGSGLRAAECIAHRGDSIRHQDNTVAAIESAWKVGADGVELDVRMTGDGQLVLFHDPELNKRPISEMTYEELDAATPEYHVPTLKEGLLAAAAGKALLLDLKDEREEFLKRVIEQVQAATISGSRVMLQSTSLKGLKFLREHAPHETELFHVTDLSRRGAPPVATQLATDLAELGLQGITAKGRRFVDKAYVAAFHERGLKYYVWTINPPERIRHYVGLGVDGVITDDPAAFRKVVPAGELKNKPEKKLPLPGEVFAVQGHTAFLICPPQPRLEGPTPWVWYAPTLPGLPGKPERWMFERFLAEGIAIAGVDVGESYGSPQGRTVYQALYQELTASRGMAAKACLLTRSRGGLMLANWAVEHPESVAGIAGIYPVCNLESYPGLARACGAYGMSEQELKAKLALHNPVERLAPLAKAGVPILHLHGNHDTVVPLEGNSGLMMERYRALGGPMSVEVIEGGGHDLNPDWFKSQSLVDFVIRHAVPQK